LEENPSFSNNTQRVRNRTKLSEFLSLSIRNFEAEELEKIFLEKDVPYGRVRNMQEVFELPEAQAMILEEKMPDGEISQRVKTVAFDIITND